jgi:hypothetical protein
MSESRRDAEREAVERRLRGEAVRVDENNPDVYFVPLPLALEAIAALDAVRSPQGEGHEHEWVDARNEAVRSGEVCLGCGAIRPSPQGEDHEAARLAIADAVRALDAGWPGEAWLALKAAMQRLEAEEER